MPRRAKRAENRGGVRQGVQGTAYANRSDLNEGPRVQRPHVAAAAAAPPPAVVAGAQAPAMPNLMGETWYPDRPVTHGMPTGPGAGPEVLGDPVVLTPIEKLRRMYRANPNPDLLELLVLAEAQGG